MMDFLIKQKLINPSQHGFLKATSKTNTQDKITCYGKQYNQLDRTVAK